MNFDAFTKIVADSPERIRRCDVFRLVSECPREHVNGLREYIAIHRPDLVSELEYCLEEELCLN